MSDANSNSFDPISPAYNPDGVVERDPFDLIVIAKWNIRRCEILESQLSSEAHPEGLSEESTRKLDCIQQFKKSSKIAARRHSAVLRHITGSLAVQHEGK